MLIFVPSDLSGICGRDHGRLGCSVLRQEGVGRVRRRQESSGHLQVRRHLFLKEQSVFLLTSRHVLVLYGSAPPAGFQESCGGCGVRREEEGVAGNR